MSGAAMTWLSFGLILTGVLGKFMWPLVDISMKSIYAIIGLS